MSTQDPYRTYLIDFGLSKKYLEPNGKHIEHSKVKKFLGNYLFCSMNTCRALSTSRRDDFESIFYIVSYLINGFRLPWSGTMIQTLTYETL